MSQRNRAILATSLLAMAALAGCSDAGTGPSAPSVDGTWVGKATVTSEFVPTFTFHLVQSSDGSITGTGRLETDKPAISVDLTIGSGTNNFPSVNFAILNPAQGDLVFQGTMDEEGKTIRGVLTGGGTETVPLGLVRK